MNPTPRIGGTCAAPDCYNTVLFSSTTFCTQHQLAAHATLTDKGHHAASQLEKSRPSGRVLTARRGRQPWGAVSRNPVRRQEPPRESSRKSPSTRGDTQARQPNVTRWENIKTSTQLSPGRSDDKREKDQSTRGRKVDNADNNRLSEKSIPKDRSTIESSAGTAKTAAPTVIILSDTSSSPAPPSPTIEKTANIPREHDVAEKAYMEPRVQSPRKPKLDTKSSGHVPLSLYSEISIPTEKESPEHLLKKLKPAIASELKRSLGLSSPTNKLSKVSTRISRLREVTSESKHLEKALPKKASSRKATPEKERPSPDMLLPKMHAKIDNEVNMAGTSDVSDGAVAQSIQAALLSLRTKRGMNRQNSLATFDSVAFDSIIYRQSRLRPPPGVSLSTRIVKGGSMSRNGDHVYLPVNPAIHGMHKRSQRWYKEKSEEIKRRPSRKAWFGKVEARQRWLRAEGEKLERSRQQAQHDGTMPPFEPPKPRSVKRILDFGDVPEDELPEHVRSNPAWLKTCAWFRMCEEQVAQHQRKIDKSKEEAELFFKNNCNAGS
ncbi:hypothetical protein FSHL1_005972 [Fusarium sambucinum]